MPEVVESLWQLFTDDAKIFRSVDLRDNEGNLRLQADLDKLCEWSKKWQLPFNTEKCTVLHIGFSNPCYQYTMNEMKLGTVHEEKDLGVIVDSELKFRKHCAAAVKKANMKLGMIKKSFACLDEDVLLPLYTSLVRSHLEYGNLKWGPHNKENSIAVGKATAESLQISARGKRPVI